MSKAQEGPERYTIAKAHGDCWLVEILQKGNRSQKTCTIGKLIRAAHGMKSRAGVRRNDVVMFDDYARSLAVDDGLAVVAEKDIVATLARMPKSKVEPPATEPPATEPPAPESLTDETGGEASGAITKAEAESGD